MDGIEATACAEDACRLDSFAARFMTLCRLVRVQTWWRRQTFSMETLACPFLSAWSRACICLLGTAAVRKRM
jgi:hypothetical protein